jgi:hypothetical protein
MPTLSLPSYILDESKRKTITALIANGSSRRAAARYIGCSASTIARTAARDPQFAAELARAEQALEISLLHSIQAAAKNGKNWRAATWLLERRNPEEFATRDPDLLTDQQVADIIAHMIHTIHDDLTEESYRRAFQKLDELLSNINSIKAPILVEPNPNDVDAPQRPSAPDSWSQFPDSPSQTRSPQSA